LRAVQVGIVFARKVPGSRRCLQQLLLLLSMPLPLLNMSGVCCLAGIMASQINATYNGFAPGTPCLGRKKMHTIWPPTAGSILPTGLNCWMYMVQPRYSARSRRWEYSKQQ
jgi:hypothetical protein